MRFGPVPLDDAEGAILAHSLRLPGGRLRKGRILAAGDIAGLRAAGEESVIVARLEPGDLDEDRAAGRIAEALAGDGLRLSAPATGRVNLYAEGPGILILDVARIEALNRVDPMVTFATLPPFARTVARTMVGTVKIISYGVSGAVIDRAVAAAAGALRLAPVQMRSAALILTDVGDGPGKGEDAIRGRLTPLGMTLQSVEVVPHRTGPLAEALARSTADIALILTASATSDPADVAPEAVRRAGGAVTRFGMPVDPGNLLFLGALDGRPVIGLPGCARSPALNGADWVLERTVCGLPPSGEEIAAMGVGGLLKESPARGLPREGKRQ